MELHRFFRYAIEKMCKEKKSLNHFTDIYIKKQDLSLSLYYKHYICDTDSNLKNKVILLFAAVILIVIATVIKIYFT